MFSRNFFYSLASALVVFAQEKAKIITDNPSDVVLRADFPSAFSQNVVGIIQFYSLNGTTKVHVDITGLPKNAGMFSYHIHENPVGKDGDCEKTGKHFNPFGASPDCELQKNDAFCQVGDLSGKHGLINTTCFETYFYDPYLSLDPSNPQYIGNKAINIHLENLDKLACANIKPSNEPEDLVLLDYEQEYEQVKQYEDVTGVKIEDRSIDNDDDDDDDQDYDEKSSSDYSRRDENSTDPKVVEEIVEVIEDEELAKEAEEVSNDYDDSESDKVVEKDEENSNSNDDDDYSESIDEEESNSLDDLINKDIENHRSNYSQFNSSMNYTYIGNSTNATGDHTSSENVGVPSTNFESMSIIGSILIGVIMAYTM